MYIKIEPSIKLHVGAQGSIRIYKRSSNIRKLERRRECILTYISYIDYASYNISFTTLTIVYIDEYTLMSIYPHLRGNTQSRGMATFSCACLGI